MYPSPMRVTQCVLAVQESNSEMQSDWLGCISSKTGLPKVLLTFAIFLSALGMIWLAFSTTVTASEQRITTQPRVCSTRSANADCHSRFVPDTHTYRTPSLCNKLCVLCVLQKLTLYGDLEYLKSLEQSSLFTKVTPIGPEVQAPPLPMKLTVEQL